MCAAPHTPFYRLRDFSEERRQEKKVLSPCEIPSEKVAETFRNQRENQTPTGETVRVVFSSRGVRFFGWKKWIFWCDFVDFMRGLIRIRGRRRRNGGVLRCDCWRSKREPFFSSTFSRVYFAEQRAHIQNMAASTSGDKAADDSLYPIAVLIDELKNEDIQVSFAGKMLGFWEGSSQAAVRPEGRSRRWHGSRYFRGRDRSSVQKVRFGWC